MHPALHACVPVLCAPCFAVAEHPTRFFHSTPVRLGCLVPCCVDPSGGAQACSGGRPTCAALHPRLHPRSDRAWCGRRGWGGLGGWALRLPGGRCGGCGPGWDDPRHENHVRLRLTRRRVVVCMGGVRCGSPLNRLLGQTSSPWLGGVWWNVNPVSSPKEHACVRFSFRACTRMHRRMPAADLCVCVHGHHVLLMYVHGHHALLMCVQVHGVPAACGPTA